MSLTIELPHPVNEELVLEAQREGISAEDHATLLVVLIMAFLKGQDRTPFQEAVRSFIAQRAADVDQIASAFEDLVRRCLRAHEEGKADSPFDVSPDVLLSNGPPGKEILQAVGRVQRTIETGNEELPGQQTHGKAATASQPLVEPLPPPADAPTEEKENAASIALLESWLEQDATDDPHEIDKTHEELDEFKRAINAERERAGARRIYP
jgi:hypothetical protein